MKTSSLSLKSFNSPLYLAPSAWVEHIPFAFWLVENLKPKLIVELGVHYGVSYFSLCQAVEAQQLGASCYGVDNWKGDEHAGFYSEEVFNEVNTYNSGHYAGFSYLLKSDFNAALSYFQDGSIDLLHIDGLHLYEAVKNDFEQWLPKLSNSSIVLFHDISVRERDFGVYKFWEELTHKYPSFSFIHGYGLGILCTGKNIPKQVSELFKLNESDIQITRTIYSRLGSGILEKLKNKELEQTIESLLTEIRTIRKEQLAVNTTALEAETSTDASRLFREKQLLEQINLLELNNQAVKELLASIKEGNKVQAERIEELQIQNNILREKLETCTKHEEELLNRNNNLQATLQQSLHYKDELHALEERNTHLSKKIADKSFIIATKEREIANLKSIALDELHKDEQLHENSSGDISAGHPISNTQSHTDTTNHNMSKVITFTKFTAKSPFWLLKGTFKKQLNYLKIRKNFLHVPEDLFDDYLLLLNNALFDADWYLTQYPDVKQNKIDPILHYLTHGHKEARDPSKNFSTFNYLFDNPDVKKDNKNPLIHYLRHGKAEGRTYEASTLEANRNDGSSSPVARKQVTKPFKKYKTRITGKNRSKDYKIILESELFDETWYFNAYPLVYEQGIDPIEHYLNIGYFEGKDPNPLFSTTWYLTKYDDVKKGGDNPFVHYLSQGYKECRDPHPLFQSEWYFHYNPDCETNETNPLLHYFKHGAIEGREVHPLFDNKFYARQTGLKPEDGGPLFHYVMEGWQQGFNPNPFFDVTYYIDNVLNGVQQEPLSHFIQESVNQKISPSAYFDTDFYCHTNQLNAKSAADPLIHFLTKGIKVLRRPSPLFRIYQFNESDALFTITQTTELEQYVQKGELDPVYEYIETKTRIQINEKERLRSNPIKKGNHFELKEPELQEAINKISFKKVEQPSVSVIIPYYKARKYLIECLLSLYNYSDLDKIEVILINDNSQDDIKTLVGGISNLIYHENGKNEGFVKSCNKGASIAKGDNLLFFNNDAQITKDAIEAMASVLDNDTTIGVVGPKVLYPSGHLQEAGCRLFTDGSSSFIGLDDEPSLERYNFSKEVDYVSGCSLMIRKNVFEKIGGFSLEFEPGYCEDVDLCLKTRKEGYKVWYTHQATIYHHLSATTPDSYKNFHILKNEGKLFTKWFDKIQELNDVKVLSFYFPQFHPYKENEFWWGKGFTEWSNVSKTLPNYEGHIQPQLPSDQGFYDIRLVEAMEHQTNLAEKYGVSGFCFYYYWFAGKRIMELPIDRMLSENKPDFPFCICWANENFTRRWDGGNNEIMLGQNHSDEDDEAVIKDMLKYATHKNYIRVNNKPMVLLYRFSLFPDIKRTTKLWRKVAMEIGIGEIYLGFVESFQHAYLMDNPKDYGFDFSTGFPPHQNSAPIPVPGKLLNETFTGTVHDYREMVLNYTGKVVPGFKRFPGTMPGWDNTPRQKNKPNIFAYTNPGSFQAWLEYNLKISGEQNPPGERFVFINAWNEWAEGAFLEPSVQHGHGYLEAIRNAKQSWLK